MRSMKADCRRVVQRYREVREDDREFPEFFIHCLAGDGSKGNVRLYRKAYGKKPYISKGSVHFESIAELALVMECFGKAWDSSTPA